jgi:hypothetical protein
VKGTATRLGRAGLAATGVSIACTIAVAAAGPSLMEPALPGPASQPPWTLDLRLDPYLAVGLAAAALAAGTLGLGLSLRAMRLGWTVTPRYVLLAGVIAALVAGATGPFGTSDFLSYAAYGRELVTGHNPYLMAPQALARLGDPVARAVQDWAGTPSVYGALASGVFGFASLIGGTSARLTVFVLDLLNAGAFAATGLLLDRLARRLGSTGKRLRAAVLWTCNPLLLQVLVAGSHVDGLAAVCGIGGIAVLAPVIPNGAAGSRPGLRALAAGAILGLGFAVKPTVLLVFVGVAIAVAPPLARAGSDPPSRFARAASGPPSRFARAASGPPSRFARAEKNPSPARARSTLAGLAAGFLAVAAADVTLIGRAGVAQSLRASGMVSVGSPWRVVRTLLRVTVMSESAADDVVRVLAVVLMVGLAAALLRPRLRNDCAIKSPVDAWAWAPLALVLAWLVAWPYVLPWYDALGWALLPLLPATWFDWLLLARTAALAFGYLPARSTGITIPGGLRWMEPVVRSAVTPAVLAAVTLLLVIAVRRRAGRARPSWPGRPSRTSRRAGLADANQV